MNQSVHACMVPGGSCKLQELLRLAMTNTALIQRQLQGPSFMTRSFPAMQAACIPPDHWTCLEQRFGVHVGIVLTSMRHGGHSICLSWFLCRQGRSTFQPRVLVGVGVSVNMMYATDSSTGITVRLFWCMIAPSIYFVVLVAFGRYEVQGGAQPAKGRQPSGNSHLDRMRDTREELLSSGECAVDWISRHSAGSRPSSSGATCGSANERMEMPGVVCRSLRCGCYLCIGSSISMLQGGFETRRNKPLECGDFLGIHTVWGVDSLSVQ